MILPDHPYADIISEKLLAWGIRLADSLGVETWHYTAFPDDTVYKREEFMVVSAILNKAMRTIDDGSMRTDQNGFKCWAMLKPRPDNRRVHKRLYLNTDGFF